MKTQTTFSRQRAFSMVEVVVAAILFAVASAGIFATITRTKRTESDIRVKASLFSKKILDGLSKEVDALTWNTGGLTLGNHNVPADADFSGCTASYVVSDGGDSTRKVVLTVNCP